MVTLREYHPDAPIHTVRLKRDVDGTDIGRRDWERYVIRYAAGTVCTAVLADPERPGMADVQLPNGKLVRVMLADVEVVPWD